MLFLVSSDPYFTSNIDAAPARKKFRSWIDDLKNQNKVINTYHKMGKGSIIFFDVSSNNELHDILTQWLNIVEIPVKFDIIPLVSPKQNSA